MDRASFRPLAELGISPPSIVAIQQPSGDQAISLMRSPVKLTDTPSTYGGLTGNRLRTSKTLLYDKHLSLKEEYLLQLTHSNTKPIHLKHSLLYILQYRMIGPITVHFLSFCYYDIWIHIHIGCLDEVPHGDAMPTYLTDLRKSICFLFLA